MLLKNEKRHLLRMITSQAEPEARRLHFPGAVRIPPASERPIGGISRNIGGCGRSVTLDNSNSQSCKGGTRAPKCRSCTLMARLRFRHRRSQGDKRRRHLGEFLAYPGLDKATRCKACSVFPRSRRHELIHSGFAPLQSHSDSFFKKT